MLRVASVFWWVYFLKPLPKHIGFHCFHILSLVLLHELFVFVYDATRSDSHPLIIFTHLCSTLYLKRAFGRPFQQIWWPSLWKFRLSTILSSGILIIIELNPFIWGYYSRSWAHSCHGSLLWLYWFVWSQRSHYSIPSYLVLWSRSLITAVSSFISLLILWTT